MTTLHIQGGKVLTPEMDVIEGDVLVDQSEGIILSVGETAPGDRTLDASESLIMPGLVNAHCHTAMTLLRGYADDKPLESWLQEDIWPVEAALTENDIRAGTRLGLLEMIKAGVTTVNDMYFYVPTIAEAVAEAGMRARLGHGIITIGKPEQEARADFEEGLTVARTLDGAAGGRIQTALMPHALTTVSADLLEEYIPRARADDIPLHYHANETIEEVNPILEEYDMRPLAFGADLGMCKSGDFIAHGVHVNDEEISILADNDVGVAHCPASNMKLASGIAPVQQMVDAGVNVSIGTDGAASNNDLDMFDELRDAAMIGKLKSNDARAVSAPTAVKAATSGGAEVLGFNSGRIEPDALADIIVIDFSQPHLTPAHNVLSHLAYAVRGSDVRHTIVDGQIIMEDRAVQTLDECAVREQAASTAAELITRAET